MHFLFCSTCCVNFNISQAFITVIKYSGHRSVLLGPRRLLWVHSVSEIIECRSARSTVIVVVDPRKYKKALTTHTQITYIT